jgi:hypothetical protein
MLDARSVAEVLELRVTLQGFASRQSDQGVQICCRAVDLDLARILARQDDQMLRELAASVEQLAKAVQTARTADQGEGSIPGPRDPCPALRGPSSPDPYGPPEKMRLVREVREFLFSINYADSRARYASTVIRRAG